MTTRAERRAARREAVKTGLMDLPKVVEKLEQIPWTPFEKTGVLPGDMEKLTLAGQRHFRGAFVNSRYQVLKFDAAQSSEWPPMVWLSIRRQDRQPIRDWRDLQRIKNELVGPENEAVELFPAESRLMDTSNQYHLFVLQDREARFPFGVGGRLVMTPEELAKREPGAKQRAFEE